MLDYLKVKLMSLAAEAKIIRKIENNRLRRADYARVMLNLDKTIERHVREIIRLKRAVAGSGGSAGCQSRVNQINFVIEFHEYEIERLKRQGNKTKVTHNTVEYNDTVYHGLHQHRIVDVRREARSTSLAYGFLRGLAYNDIEKNSHTKPNWDKVFTMIRKYGEGDSVIMQQNFELWKAAAVFVEKKKAA